MAGCNQFPTDISLARLIARGALNARRLYRVDWAHHANGSAHWTWHINGRVAFEKGVRLEMESYLS